MATKKDENKTTSAKAQTNNAEKTELVSKEVKEKLSDSEKAALEVQEAQLQGEVPNKKYKLARKNTQYTDPTNGWTLTGEEEKELPKTPSADLLARIKEGFIVEV